MTLVQTEQTISTTDWNSWKLWNEETFGNPQISCSGIGNHLRTNGIQDLAVAEYLSSIFAGYMTAPVVCISDSSEVTLTAKTFVAYSVEELLTNLTQQAITEDLYLYTLTFHPKVPFLYAIDTTTFDVKKLDEPEFSKEYWRIRYSSVPKS